MNNCKWNKLLVLLCVMVIMLCVPACAEDEPASTVEGRVLINEDYESSPEKKVQMEGANQPYEAREIGLSTERARSGKHSVKIDVTYKHGLNVYLVPRTNENPRIIYGSIGGQGAFDIDGLNIQLRPDRGYVLTLYVWVEQVDAHNSVRFQVKTVSNCDLGQIKSHTLLEQEFIEPTEGWVKVEQELTSYLLEQLEAQGNQTEGILLHSISMSSFANNQYPMKVYIDDITLKEVPMSVVAEYKAKRLAAKKKHTFRSYPKAENTFVWGTYGGLLAGGRDWYMDYPRSGGNEAVRLEQIKRTYQAADRTLLDLRRHYCNTLIQGGGMLFPNDVQASYDHLKLSMDKCAEYGVGWVPSTYLTQHYTSASKEQCIAEMRKVTGIFKNHPGLFAYLLVDEPQPSTAEDFYWGKQQMEAMDANHPCLQVCNGVMAVREFSPTLPIVGIDYYPISPIPSSDKGAWAVGDMVRYSRRSGAKRIWVLPQVFEASSWRATSATEFKLQIYGSLAEGATGFAPYSYGGSRTSWYQRGVRNAGYSEDKNLIDVFGNPSPYWDEMKKLGPYLRSVGPLLIESERLADDAVTANSSEIIATSGGRKRPMCIARMFQDNARNARYIVVYNNTRFYPWSFNVGISKVGPGEKLLDLYSLRDVPFKGSTFPEYLRPGDGRVYAIASADKLDAIKKEVATSRFNLEYDLLKLEIRLAKKMGTDVAPAEKAAADSKELLAGGDFLGALAQVTSGKDILEKQNLANIPFSKANTAIEASRAALGRINETMSNRMLNSENGFKITDPGVKEITDKMIALADSFYALQTQLLQKGPESLADSTEALLADVQVFERSVNTLFGI